MSTTDHSVDTEKEQRAMTDARSESQTFATPNGETKNNPKPGPASNKPSDRLTAKQLQIAQLLADGHDNAEIQKRMTISNSRVGQQISAIKKKLGAKTRGQVAAIAVDLGIVKVGHPSINGCKARADPQPDTNTS